MGRLTKAELTTAIDILIHPQSGDESDIFGAHVTSIEAMKELKAYKDIEEQGRLIEVIRCKDCAMESTCVHTQYQGEDGYCSMAELKELEK